MKILHLSNTAGRLGGGVAEVVKSLLYYQTKITSKSHLWFMGSDNLINELSKDSKVIKSRIKAITPLCGIKNTISPFFLLKKNKVSKDYQILHQHGLFLPISVFTLLLNNIKIIINPHGYLEPEKLKVSKLKKKFILWLFERKNLQNCHCLIACSNQEATSLRDWGLTQPIVILPNGIDDSLLRKTIVVNTKLDFKAKYNIKNDSKILLFLSRVHPFKGLELLLESILAIKEHFRNSDWVFVIAGPDELNHTKKLKSIVNNQNIEDIVKFVGPQYNNDKYLSIDSADCFILPSKGENFGIVVIEALARGIPVISTKNTPWSELIDYSCGWWIDRTKEDFKSVLLKLINTDSKSLLKMGKNGISLVEKKYLWSKITQQSIQVYKWVLNDFNPKFKKGFSLFE